MHYLSSSFGSGHVQISVLLSLEYIDSGEFGVEKFSLFYSSSTILVSKTIRKNRKFLKILIPKNLHSKGQR